MCGSRFAQCQVQRVQVPGTHVDKTADVALGAHHRVHLMGLQQAGFVAIPEAAQFFGVFGEAFEVAGLVGQVAVAPGQVAGDLKSLDALSDDFHRFQAHEFHLTHTVRTDHVGELIEAVPDTANQLPAIASAGAPTDLVRFEQHHAEAAFGQFKCRVQSREPAADHAHVGQHFALEHRKLRLRQAAGGVVGGRVLVVRDGLPSTSSHLRDPDSCVYKI